MADVKVEGPPWVCAKLATAPHAIGRKQVSTISIISRGSRERSSLGGCDRVSRGNENHCPDCGGSGDCMWFDGVGTVDDHPCEDCYGEATCERCGGTGQVADE